METKVEALENNQKKLTVTVDAEDVNGRIRKQYKDFALKYNFPGFRKGKAPRPVIDSALGKEAVRRTVTDDMLNSLYVVAMDEQDLIPVGSPDFEDDDALAEEGKPYTFAVTVETRPEIELTDYGRVSIKLPSTQATEEDIDKQAKELLDYYYTIEDADQDASAERNSIVEVALQAWDADGNDIEPITSDSRLYEIGGGMLPASFDEAVIGMKKGEKKTVEIDLSEGCILRSRLDNPGKTTIDIEVKTFKKKVIPELTDEWAQETAGFEGGVKELRERLADNIRRQKEEQLPSVREEEILFELRKRVEYEPTATLQHVQERDLLSDFFMQLQRSNMTLDQYLSVSGLTDEQFRADLKRQARYVLMQDLALDAWARHLGVQVSDGEIIAEFIKSGAEDPYATKEEWSKDGRITILRASIKRARAIESIIANDLDVEELAPGESLPSVAYEEERIAKEQAEAQEAKEVAASETPAVAETPAPAVAETPAAEVAETPAPAAEVEAAGEDNPSYTKTDLTKMKVAEVREVAERMGLETGGLKKSELIEAVLAAK